MNMRRKPVWHGCIELSLFHADCWNDKQNIGEIFMLSLFCVEYVNIYRLFRMQTFNFRMIALD